MPYENEHSCRLAPPGDYREFARKNDEQESEGKPIDVIYGIKMKDGKRVSEIQSLRYKTETWTQEQAEKHCQGRKGEFEAAEPEIQLEPKLTETYFFASPVSLGEGEHLVDIEILRSGEWKHPKAPGGTLILPKAKLEEFKQNFDDQVCGEDLPLDIDHKPAKTGAVGWLKQMWINTVGQVSHLFARLDVTDPETQEAVKNGSLRYFSPQIIIDYEDPSTGKFYDLIRSGALTAWPFIKGMSPAVCNFSEIQEFEQKTEKHKKTDLLLAREVELAEARKAGKTVALELIKINKQLDLKDQVIIKLQQSTRIDLLADSGALSPYEAQKCRGLSLNEPRSVDLAIELLGGRGPAVQLGQQSILTQRKRSSRFNLDEEMAKLDLIEDPARRDLKLKELHIKLENMKERRGIK